MTTHETHEHGHGHGHGHGPGHGTDFAAAAELLDLDAEVFADFLQDVVASVVAAVGDQPVRRIADLGCGSGTGSLALARRFPDAQVTPVDVAEPLLAHLAAAAERAGVAARVHPLAADLDAGWPAELAELDLVWASASLHHVAEPPRRLAEIRSALVPGGVLVLIEIDDANRFQPTFLSAAAGDLAALEARVRALLLPGMLAAMPYLQADWRSLLDEAGFTIEVDQAFELDLRPPLPAATGRYAAVSMQRLLDQLGDLDTLGQLPDGDRAALEELAGDGPGAVAHRTDLAPRSRRHLWIARRR
jgi:trans-aconitate methyltransferase